MIEYREDAGGVTAAGLHGFFEGWPDPPSAEALQAILARSTHAILAWDTDADRAAGFITAISDGVLAAYVPLLEVRPEWRGRGIGAELVRRMTARLADVYMVDAVCDESVAPFYAKLGFARLAGMARRNRARQSAPSAASTPAADVRRVIEEYNDAWNRHDVDGVLARMTDDCIFESTRPAPDGERFEGKPRVREFLEAFFARSPSARFTAEELFVAGDRCIVRWRYDWTRDGVSGHVRGADILRVRDGKVAEKLAYVKG